jgi:4-hydroxy-tetrahydrodipicolinate reductase
MKLAVMGATGRMGRALIKEIIETPKLTLAGGTEFAGHEAMGQDLGTLAGLGAVGVVLSEDALELVAQVDGIIDFTTPEASVELAGLAAQARIVHVMGTTGFDDADEAKIRAASRHATIIKSGNMSLGVNLIAELTRQVGASLGDAWDIEILEMHHRHKVDAPSGTALLMGEAAAQGRGVELADVRVSGRDGETGARTPGTIGFASLRGGSSVGEHKVIFATDNERIELVHKAEDRQIFARGALTAVQWGQGRRPGIYSMRDVLGLNL